MCKNKVLIGPALLLLSFFGLHAQNIVPAAELTGSYFNLIEGKDIAIVTNHTGRIGEKHLVDSLLNAGFDIKMVFSPEHGFRGKADAGEHVADFTDKKTQLQVRSLYGKNKKPSIDLLRGIDIVVFDIQDVGVRFYTYISTLHYVMESCAEANIQFIVLDRPNPNGFYVDGPVLQKEYQSFVGMHPIPLVHGLTIGELALMINGEKWIGEPCQLTVIPCQGYTHRSYYQLPVPPSPNLPNMKSVYLYPSLGLMEGTIMSVGRGTSFPFQVYGHPTYRDGNFTFTPEAVQGAKKPKYKGEECHGVHLKKTVVPVSGFSLFTLQYLIDAYQKTGSRPFFNSFFRLLAGNKRLENQIKEGMGAMQIKNSWDTEIKDYLKIRKKYLLYTDF